VPNGVFSGVPDLENKNNFFAIFSRFLGLSEKYFSRFFLKFCQNVPKKSSKKMHF
jgi:hypothetical protein